MWKWEKALLLYLEVMLGKKIHVKFLLNFMMR